jgi:helix-turn-helix protein
MVHRAQPTTFHERVEILEHARAGQSDSASVSALHCSIWTVRKWRRIGQHHGRAGLAPPIGRPPSGPLGAVLPELREAILQLRRAHPGWGADTILAELRTEVRYYNPGMVPLISAIAACLSAAPPSLAVYRICKTRSAMAP